MGRATPGTSNGRRAKGCCYASGPWPRRHRLLLRLFLIRAFKRGHACLQVSQCGFEQFLDFGPHRRIPGQPIRDPTLLPLSDPTLHVRNAPAQPGVFVNAFTHSDLLACGNARIIEQNQTPLVDLPAAISFRAPRAERERGRPVCRACAAPSGRFLPGLARKRVRHRSRT